MRPRGATLVACVSLLCSCAYHNVTYNAERLYAEAEAHRRAGEQELSRERYLDVVRKTGQALRARPDADWKTEALFLLGRARLRLGELSAAKAALEKVAREAPDGVMRGEALVYLAALRAESGDARGAMRTVNQALDGSLRDEPRAEAHLLRGRLLLERSHSDLGWWDLDQAGRVDPRVRVEAGLERLRWAIRHEDRERSRTAMAGLFARPTGGARADSIIELLLGASAQWGPAVAAGLMEEIGTARWDPGVLDAVALQRARFLREGGDVIAADQQTLRVAAGLGGPAAEARLMLASWRVERARDLAEVYSVRSILLPASTDPRVVARLAAVDDLEAFASLGLDDPLGWFAAAEVARDRLGADYVARGLFLAYADRAPTDPWAPKALLAAIQVSPEETDRVWLRERLETHRDSPYVLAASGRSAAGFEALEEELDVRLGELTGR